MSKTKKQRQKQSINASPTTAVEEPTLQLFKKSLFETLTTGYVLGVLIWVMPFSIAVFFHFGPVADLHFFWGSQLLVSFLTFCWLISTPRFAISKKEIVVCRIGKQAIHYPISCSFHIKTTMIRGAGRGGYCFLFLTFMDDRCNLKKRWISGCYSLERARELVLGLEDHHIRYYLKGRNALYLANCDLIRAGISSSRRVKESTL